MNRSSVQATFARQLAERNAKANPQKKFKSAAPKGTKLAAGYVDRSKQQEHAQEDEMEARVKNLEDSMKRGDIDRETFEKLVQEITGGDIRTTHLVRGLDRKLLERVRRGEDVMGQQPNETVSQEPAIDEELDALEDQEVGPIIRETAEKKGEAAPPAPVAGVKRSRNDILAELKRQREEAAAAAAAEHEKRFPSLGPGFRKVTANGESTRLEIDGKGREILIITDAHGREKRKVRKRKAEQPADVEAHAEGPQPDRRHDPSDDDQSKFLDPPPIAPKAESTERTEESEDEDIFEGVGSAFNPLADLEGADSSDDEHEETKPSDEQARPTANEDSRSGEGSTPPVVSGRTTAKRDYFKSTSRLFPRDSQPSESSHADATVRAALRKVRTLDPDSALLNDPDSQEARLKKRAAELAARDRDMEDIDMGFGGSRFDDADEMEREGEKVKFSEWKGLGAEGDDDGEDPSGRGGKKRKRGSKKKKGDKNSVTDVLHAMERQKKALG